MLLYFSTSDILTLGMVLHEKIYKVTSCLCLLVCSQCIITFMVHTSVAIVVVNMQCIQVVPALPANSTANKGCIYMETFSPEIVFKSLRFYIPFTQKL